MTSLESIVLPLTESRALVEAGVVLDTALAWYPEHCDDYEAEAPASLWPDEWKRIAEGQPVVCVCEEMEDHKPICPAPVLSELLDAITARFPECALEMLWSDDEWEIDLANDLPQVCQGKSGKNHLASLAALLMEVKPC